MNTKNSTARRHYGPAAIISLAAIAGCGGGGDAAVDSAAAQAENVGLDAAATALAVRNDATLPVYHVTDLGTLGGPSSSASALNDLGQVTGTSTLAGTPLASHAFLYAGGALRDLGVLPPSSAPPAGQAFNSNGSGINNRGQVTGGSAVSVIQPYGLVESHAFVYSSGTMTDLRVPAIGASGRDINNAGEVVGTATTSVEPTLPGVFNAALSIGTQAYVYRNGATTFIKMPAGETGSSSFGLAINRDGQVTGVSSYGDVLGYPFYYAGTSAMILKNIGLQKTTSNAINDRGVIAGSRVVPASAGLVRAYKATAGVATDLGSLGGSSASALGLNNAGDAVGSSYLADDKTQHAFVSTAGKMYDLNGMLDASGTKWTLTAANDINNVGQIVGTGVIGGKTHAFLLTPVPRSQHVGRYSEDRHVSTALGNDAVCQMDQAETLFPSKCQARSAQQ